MPELQGKVAVVIGSPAEFAGETVRSLVTAGARVFVGAGDSKQLSALVAEHGHNRVDGALCDWRDQESVAALVEKCVHRFGRLDIGCNIVPAATALSSKGSRPQNSDELRVEGVLPWVGPQARQILKAGRGGWLINIAVPLPTGLVEGDGQPAPITLQDFEAVTKAAAQEFSGQGLRVDFVECEAGLAAKAFADLLGRSSALP